MNTKGEFLQSKFSNFILFLRSIVAKVPVDSRAHAEGFLSQYDGLSQQSLVALVVHFATYKSNIGACVDKLLMEAKLPSSAFSPDEMARVHKYLEMFIDIVCE